MNSTTQYVCARCVMDRTAREISFDARGICNFCIQAEQALAEVKADKSNFQEVIGTIAREGFRNDYDVLIGLSGGVDSSYTLHLAVEMGLRPLCFSIDTGWNKPEADENIMRLVEGLKVPFYRYTIDLAKFRDLQGAFMRAGVKNIEIPTDHVLMAASLDMAAKNKIKYVLSGGNVATESIMPASWGHNARDLTYLKDVYWQMTGKRLAGLPLCSIWQWNWYRWAKKVQNVYLLDYFSYNRKEAEALLIEKYGFKSTGEKHEENHFTWWFQNYYLFEKFGIDKRKAHYSSLIMSGQMSRAEAMEKLTTNPVYPELGFEGRVLEYPMSADSQFKQDKWYGRISKIVKWLS